MAADRDLLFGLLALQNGLIDQDQLLAALRDWTRHKARPLADHLVGRDALDADGRAGIEALVALHLRKHGGDAGRSLASLTAGRSTRERIEALEDPDLTVTFARVGSDSGPTEAGVDATATYSVGSATADGQRFRVLRPHAKGGLGAVFVALDGELNREVALKQILDRHADDPASRQRFLLEAEITGGLEHPGIVPVYGLGAHADGRPYYAMRFIRGDSLREAIDRFHGDASLKADPGRRSLELRKLLRRFLDVCNAIEYAHSRGVLHRDIKPGNVIVGKHGETLVVDWGLAKARGQGEAIEPTEERPLVPSSASGSAETLPGSAIGTPAYMSPEQARGDLDALGPRSDVYSLGATLYALLVGKAPFGGDDLGALLRAVQAGAFATPRRLDPAIDPPLEAICLKAMAATPGDRYGSARALADDLERWLADESVDAYPEPWTRTLTRWLTRHRTAVTAAAAAGLVALAGLGTVAAVQTHGRRALAAKNRELEKANGRIREANAGLESANAALAEANAQVQARFELAREAIRSLRQAVEEEETLKEGRLRPLRDKLLGSARRFYDRLGGLLEGQPDATSKTILAESYRELGELIDRIGQKPEAMEAYRKAAALRRELAARPGAGEPERVALAEALNQQGSGSHQLGDRAGALAAFEESTTLAGPPAEGPGATIEARRALSKAQAGAGMILMELGDNRRALAAFRRAREGRESLIADGSAEPDDRFQLSDCIIGVGVMLEQSGDLAGAMAEFRRVQELLKALIDERPEVSDYRHQLGVTHALVGRLMEKTGDRAGALVEQRRFQGLMRELVDEHPEVPEFRRELANSHSWVGGVLEGSGDTAGALAEFREFRDQFRVLADEHPDVLNHIRNLGLAHSFVGRVLARRGDSAGALAEHRRHQELFQALADAHPDVPDYRHQLGVGHNWIGDLLEQSGDTAGALAEQRSYRDQFRSLADEHPEAPVYRRELAVAHTRIGHLLNAAGRPAEALAEAEAGRALLEALAEANPNVPLHRYDLASALLAAGDALRDAGRPDEARDRYARALGLAESLASATPATPSYRTQLINALRRLARLRLDADDLDGAVADARRVVALLDGARDPGGADWFGLACARATLADAAGRPGSSSPSTEGPESADRAMDALRRAAAMGYRGASAYRYEPALGPLRDRDDFRLLMLDLAFPAEPFAR